MKKKSVYHRKLSRILKSTFCEINADVSPSYTASEACARLVQISYAAISQKADIS
jgi:hypothetical protein